MLFNSLEFLLFLFVIILFLIFITRREYQQTILLISSYIFYLYSGNEFIFLLIFITLITFHSGNKISVSKGKKYFNIPLDKLYLTVGTAIPLLALGYFKYYNFFIQTFGQVSNHYFPILEILLPVGISFFTFQSLSYVFDIYRGTLKPTDSLKEYALFIAFFPQLIAGPIVRASELLPQFRNRIHITAENFQLGFTLILWGLFKKSVIADNIAPIVDGIFSNPIGQSSYTIIEGTVLFGIQIFCDFSGYTDIAIGIATIFGFIFPQNFLRPYLSANPSDFWRRWHMTLGRFFKDYLYIPLGGNRKGKLRTYINLMVTMFICGLWHGASWNFVLWGGYHGFLLSSHKFINEKFSSFSISNNFLTGTHTGLVIRIFITQYFVFLGWLFFRVRDPAQIQYCINKFIFIDYPVLTIQKYAIIGVICVIILLLIISMNKKIMEKAMFFTTFNYIEFLGKSSLKFWGLYPLIMSSLIFWLSPSNIPEFIYFAF